MSNKYQMQARVTGILVDNGSILIVKQALSNGRAWSLPGGRVEKGESLQDGMLREMEEETGLKTQIAKLLYLCDVPEADPPVLHITFLLTKRSGDIRLPSNEYDKNPIHDVKMAPIDELPRYGFSQTFLDIVKNGFPDAGSYKGLKANIGL
jgi:ADP-ribose pyrophosphatase YjhB (NUDIX family)